MIGKWFGIFERSSALRRKWEGSLKCQLYGSNNNTVHSCQRFRQIGIIIGVALKSAIISYKKMRWRWYIFSWSQVKDFDNEYIGFKVNISNLFSCRAGNQCEVSKANHCYESVWTPTFWFLGQHLACTKLAVQVVPPSLSRCLEGWACQNRGSESRTGNQQPSSLIYTNTFPGKDLTLHFRLLCDLKSLCYSGPH